MVPPPRCDGRVAPAPLPAGGVGESPRAGGHPRTGRLSSRPMVLRALLTVTGWMAGFVGAVLGAMLLIWLWRTYISPR